MNLKKTASHFTEEELKELLKHKKNAGREARIAAYRASGRVALPDAAPINKENVKSANQADNSAILKQGNRKRTKLDIILLFVEIAAIIGIVILLFLSARTLNRINQESSLAMVMPTLTATPLIQAVVLPGGHTPPDSKGNVAFNENEIPEHLRAMISVVMPTPVAYSESGRIVRIRLPSINVDAPVVSGDDWESLKKGVGISPYSAVVGKKGNVILSGHNDIFGEVFRDLDQLKTGDEVTLLTEKNAYTYIVRGTKVVQPNQVEVLNQTEDAALTLISCYPYLVDNQRIVVTAKLRE